MKRNLIYGLLICLFVCLLSGQMGYATDGYITSQSDGMFVAYNGDNLTISKETHGSSIMLTIQNTETYTDRVLGIGISLDGRTVVSLSNINSDGFSQVLTSNSGYIPAFNTPAYGYTSGPFCYFTCYRNTETKITITYKNGIVYVCDGALPCVNDDPITGTISLSSNTNGLNCSGLQLSATGWNIVDNSKTYAYKWERGGVTLESGNITSSTTSVDFSPASPMVAGTYTFSISYDGNTLFQSKDIVIRNPDPELNITYATSVKKKAGVGETSTLSDFEIEVLNSCKEYNESDFVLSIDNTDVFEVDGLTIKIKDDFNTVGSYYTPVNVSSKDGLLENTVYLVGNVVEYPKCYNVTRYVDGKEYDTYSLCTDDNGDINIDMSDCSSDFLFISSDDYFAKENKEPVGGTIYCGGRNCCKKVSFTFDEDITCEDFLFDGSSMCNNQDAQYYSFTNNSTITCSSMTVKQNSVQKRNNFFFTCFSSILASEYINIDSYNSDAMVILGNLVSKSVRLKNGNNNSIEIYPCAYIKAETLTFEQSAQNNVKIEGHVVANDVFTVDPDPNSDRLQLVQLVYDGEADNHAIVTIGNLNDGAQIVCGQYTTVNLCANPTLSTPDAIGYFGGTVIYNISSIDGWDGVIPSEEGDINYDDGVNTALYYTYSNMFSSLREIGGYASYADCMAEKNMAALLGMDDDPFIPKDKEIKILYDDFNPCSEEYESSKVQIREMGGKWFRVINGELIYCENDN
ncbi:MAG: hypothetical protein IKJ98_05465 [Bacteroidales bacterium]|nr:hypothetical protein [Bacteroidales bacterium]